MRVIGICGFAGAGKDTLASVIGYTRLSFSKVLKDATSSVYNWDRTLLEGDTEQSRKWREEPDVFWSTVMGRPFTPRMALQETGTKFREIHPDIFVNSVKKYIENSKENIVITDCRYPNEIDMIRAVGGKIVHVVRNLPPWYDAYKNGEDIDHKLHSSEVAWIRCKHDVIIDNSGDINALVAQAKTKILNA